MAAVIEFTVNKKAQGKLVAVIEFTVNLEAQSQLAAVNGKLPQEQTRPIGEGGDKWMKGRTNDGRVKGLIGLIGRKGSGRERKMRLAESAELSAAKMKRPLNFPNY